MSMFPSFATLNTLQTLEQTVLKRHSVPELQRKLGHGKEYILFFSDLSLSENHESYLTTNVSLFTEN